MKKIGFVFGFLLCVTLSFSQQNYVIEGDYIRLTDEAVAKYEKLLPTGFDLSGSDFFPPLYSQTHWACNQVAASYYMMTFETNKMKNISSDSPENQFSIYFPWNWGNGGNGWFGDNYIISMEMMKQLGVPKFSDNQADIIRDSSLWLSGYDNYYDLMHNRIKNYYRIRTNSSSGITTLKSWIFDNFGSEYYGGTGTFLANIAIGGYTFFEEGNPHEGAYVITKCGDDALHARTIVGYDDNACFDYNGDGQYTNNIDLNGDGQIDVRDWEKGAFKLAESFGPTWQGDGFCWIMYKCMADAYPTGGILNNYVHIIQPTIDYTPLLTVRLKIKHTGRERIKVKLGASSDLQAETWERIIDFPILNYQGGNKYMQGGGTEADKTLEVGLDITPLLEFFNAENKAKIFLVVYESDENNLHNGEILEFEVIDYTGNSPNGFEYASSTEIENHTQTVISVDVTLNDLNAPKIFTENLPILSSGSPIWRELEYQAGTSPHKWELLPYFEKTNSTRQFIEFEGTKLTPDEDFDGAVTLELPFDFPFGYSTTNEIKIHTDGYILPLASTNVWTQFKYIQQPMFINESIIAPLARYSMVCDYETGDGIWYEYVQDTVKIRWQCSDKGSEPWTTADFGCNLISNGSVEFVYGSRYLKTLYTNISGISYGNQSDNIFAWLDDIPPANALITLKPYPIPEGLGLNQSGVLYGTLGDLISYPVLVKVTDNNGISDTQKLDITTGIQEVNKDLNNVDVFPNPTLGHFVVKINNPTDQIVFIDVCNVYGQIVEQKMYSDCENVNIDISSFNTGIYSLRIVNGEDVWIKKIIKK